MTPEPRSVCPTCTWTAGFHDAQIHANFEVDPKHYKPKDWQKHDGSAETEQISA